MASYRYDPFGNTLSQSGSLAAANVYRFSSKEIHVTSGLMYYFGYRFYDPSMQRWLNRDPIGERGGLNLYGYVGNDPLDRIDPLGLAYGNPVSGPNGPVGPSSPYAPGLPYYPSGAFYVPPQPPSFSLPPGGVVGVGAGAFTGVGVEAGFDVVKLGNGKCQVYYYVGFGAGIGASAGVQAGTTYNVNNASDYEGYFITLQGGIGPAAGSISAAPDAWPFPVNPAPAGSAMGGGQGNLPKGPGGKIGGAATIRNYWAVGDPFCCGK